MNYEAYIRLQTNLKKIYIHQHLDNFISFPYIYIGWWVTKRINEVTYEKLKTPLKVNSNPTVICVINIAEISSDDVIQLTREAGVQVLQVSVLDQKNLEGGGGGGGLPQ